MADRGLDALSNDFLISDNRPDLGRGFQHLSHQFVTATAFTGASFKAAASAESGALMTGDWSFKVNVIDNMEELITSLDLSVSASATLWGGNVSGTAKWVESVDFKQETLLVVISARKVVGQTAYDPSKLQLTDDAKSLLTNKQFDKFYGTYGSYFVGRAYVGGWMNLIFKKDFSSLQQKRTASLELKASGMNWSTDAKGVQSVSKVIDTYSLSVQATGVGGETQPDTADWTAAKAINWVLHDWMGSLNEQNAGTLQLEMMNIWQVPGGNLDYKNIFVTPQSNLEALDEWMVRIVDLKNLADYLKLDSEHCLPTREELAQLEHDRSQLGGFEKQLKAHVENSNRLDLKSPSAVLGESENCLDNLKTSLTSLQSEIELRRPLTKADKFRLSTTGKAGVYYLAGPRNNMGPSMSTSVSQAEPLKCDGANPKVGAEIRIHSIRGIGDRHIVTAMGKNTWLEYQRGTADKNTWKIEAKSTGGDDYIRHGDFIQLTSKAYPDRTIKVAEKDGLHWATTYTYTHYWLRIERIRGQ